MKCINCKSDDVVVVLMEVFPCKYCGKNIEVEYVICRDCGVGWKSVNGEILSGTTLFDVGLNNIFDGGDETPLNMTPIINHKPHMTDYVYKCLRCQAVCYEVEKDLYECPECGFQWNVVRSK